MTDSNEQHKQPALPGNGAKPQAEPMAKDNPKLPLLPTVSREGSVDSRREKMYDIVDKLSNAPDESDATHGVIDQYLYMDIGSTHHPTSEHSQITKVRNV